MTGRSLGGHAGAFAVAAPAAPGTSLIAQGGAPATAGRLATADRSTMPGLPADCGGWELAGINVSSRGRVLRGIMAVYITIWEHFGKPGPQLGWRAAGKTAAGRS
ncbi:MAG TPA: hypothetical protein VN767_26645 [Streptosporangiaceae bacterium]|nr:hypothetical protein [Streptosporangiaceae bacterium]